MFNGQRIDVARKRRGMTAIALAKATGLSQSHLSRLTKGQADNPEPETVAALARALGFPEGFFFGEELDYPEDREVSFRRLSRMTAAERNRAKAASSFAFMLSDWVDELFDLPEPDLPDLEFSREPSEAARELRSYWGLGQRPISNMVHLLESKGVRVFSLDEKTKNIDAFSCWRRGRPFVFLNTQKTAERSRFDAAHELGHLVMHASSSETSNRAEREADEFASHVLMPSGDLRAQIGCQHTRSLDRLILAKKRWRVSLRALVYRLHNEDMISDWHHRVFYMQINKRFKSEEPDPIERETSKLWEKIFRELWKEGKTRSHVAKEINLPVREIETLAFDIVSGSQARNRSQRDAGKPELCLA